MNVLRTPVDVIPSAPPLPTGDVSLSVLLPLTKSFNSTIFLIVAAEDVGNTSTFSKTKRRKKLTMLPPVVREQFNFDN